MKNYLTVTESDPQATQILEVAWRRYAQLDQRACSLEKSSSRSGVWVAFLSLVFIASAVVFDMYSYLIPELAGMVVTGLLIITPIIVAILAVYSGKSTAISESKIIRGGAEEILKNIYVYRTLLAGVEGRRDWLGGRLVAVQRQISDALGRDLSLKPYDQDVPPQLTFEGVESDPGFMELSGGDYVKYRLETSLAWYIQKTGRYQGQRIRWIISILLAGVVGALIAAIGGPMSTWAGLIASVMFASFGWNELKNLDNNFYADNKVIQELIKIYDRWQDHDSIANNDDQFISLVSSVEQSLWFRQSDYIRIVLQTILYLEGERFVNHVVDNKFQIDSRNKSVVAEKVSDLEYIPSQDLVMVDIPAEHDDVDIQIESVPNEDTVGELVDLDSAEVIERDEVEADDLEVDYVPVLNVENLNFGDEPQIAELTFKANEPSMDEEIEIDRTDVFEIDSTRVYTKDEVKALFRKISEKYTDSPLNRETQLSDINEILGKYPPFK